MKKTKQTKKTKKAGVPVLFYFGTDNQLLYTAFFNAVHYFHNDTVGDVGIGF